jgi:hypothetical protein
LLPPTLQPTVSGSSFDLRLAPNDPVKVPDLNGDGLPDSSTCATFLACEVTVISTGTVSGVRRAVQATLRVELKPSEVFKYVYFINNYGYFMGNPDRNYINIHGDLRSNGDMEVATFTGSSALNGDIYAAANNDLRNPVTGDIASGTIDVTNVRSWGYDQYLWYGDGRWGRTRPTDPYHISNPTKVPTDVDNPSKGPFLGYRGKIYQRGGLAPMEMPAMGDLTAYETLAKTYTRKDGGTGSRLIFWDHGPDAIIGTADDRELTIIGAYDGINDTWKPFTFYASTPPQPLIPNGPDRTTGTADDGSLVIHGNRDCVYPGPNRCGQVQIEGPVVIPGDAILGRVYVQGKGVVYAGRNIHITDNIWGVDKPYYPVIREYLDAATGNPTGQYGVLCPDKNNPANPLRLDEQGVAAIEAWTVANCF